MLELLGRSDGQVKVRGFRVELGEVEAVLTQHPGVKAGRCRGAQRILSARSASSPTWCPARVPIPTTSDLRRWLQDRLPEPMVPSAYVVLEVLPLSPNGKLDRSALPRPAALNRDGLGERIPPPRTGAEEILAGIVADLLGRSRVGIHDNFFEIGVDSILGIQMVSRARQAGLAVDPAHLFRHPNIAELATAADPNSGHQEVGANATSAVAAFELLAGGIDREALERAFAESGGIEDVYPLTPVQEGMLFHTLVDPEAGHYVEQFTLSASRRARPRRHSRSPGIDWSRGTLRCGPRSTGPIPIGRTRSSIVGSTLPVEYHDWRGLTTPPSRMSDSRTISTRIVGAGSFRRSLRCRGWLSSGSATTSTSSSGVFITS